MNSRTGKQTSLKRQAPPGLSYPSLVEAIAQAHAAAQRQAAQTVNLTLTLRNWLIGYHIFEYEQQGQDRAEYGERLLETLARDLKRRIGKGFTKRYLEMFRQFYLRYPIAKSLISQLGLALPLPPSVEFKPLAWQDEEYFAQLLRRLPWTHFIELIRLDDPLKRAFYELEAMQQHWSTRSRPLFSTVLAPAARHVYSCASGGSPSSIGAASVGRRCRSDGAWEQSPRGFYKHLAPTEPDAFTG